MKVEGNLPNIRKGITVRSEYHWLQYIVRCFINSVGNFDYLNLIPGLASISCSIKHELILPPITTVIPGVAGTGQLPMVTHMA